MPLAADCDGVRVHGFTLSDAEWLELQSGIRAGSIDCRFKSCMVAATPVENHLGTRFFRHARNSACSYKHRPMTPEHLDLQRHIMQACLDAGWHADTEVDIGKRRADVLATKDARRVAFEVQLAHEPRTALKDRTEDYDADGIQVVWIFAAKANTARLQAKGPFAFLASDDDYNHVVLDRTAISLETFVDDFLAERVWFAREAPMIVQRNVSYRAEAVFCPDCGDQNIKIIKAQHDQPSSGCPNVDVKRHATHSQAVVAWNEGVDAAFKAQRGDEVAAALRENLARLLAIAINPYLECRACRTGLHKPGLPWTELGQVGLDSVDVADRAIDGGHWCNQSQCYPVRESLPSLGM